MNFVKFTAYDNSPVYINPININRIYTNEFVSGMTCIDMIGDNEQGTFFTVKEPIEKVIGVLENECY